MNKSDAIKSIKGELKTSEAEYVLSAISTLVKGMVDGDSISFGDFKIRAKLKVGRRYVCNGKSGKAEDRLVYIFELKV